YTPLFRSDLAVTVHDDLAAVLTRHDVSVPDADRTLGAQLELVRLDLAARRRTTDVERTHRQLRARLADRLSRDDANCFADVHVVTTGQVAPVAHGAHAAPRLAGEHRANHDLFDARVLDATDRGFVEELVRLNDGLSRQRIDDLFERHAPEDALAERLNDFAGLFELGDAETIEGSAIVHADHTILSDVDETAR